MNASGSAGQQHRLLLRHFFDRMLHSELVPTHADSRVTLIQILALVATPGLMILCFLMRKYARLVPMEPLAARLASLDEKMLFIYVSMVVTGFVAVVEWDTLFPDRRDYLILRPLPIGDSTLFLAKATSLCAFLALFSVAVNAFPAVMYPMFTGKSLLGMARLAFSHAVSVLAADAFIFFSCVALQGLLLNIFGRRFSAPASRVAQLLLLVALLSLFFTMPAVSFAALQQSPRFMSAFAPAWFTGLYETLHAGATPESLPMAFRACAALCVAATAFALTYILAYKRRVETTLDGGRAAFSRSCALVTPIRALSVRWLLRTPGERASFFFVGRTIARSQLHRTYFGAYVGVGLAFVIMGLVTAWSRYGAGAAGVLRSEFLSVPLVLTFFVLLGFRVVFSVPVQLRANWVFRLAERDPRDLISGVRKAMIVLGAAPVLLLVSPVYGALWGWPLAALHLAYCAMLSLILIEVLLYTLDKMPFTCTYTPGKANLKLWWWAYLFGFTNYAYSMTELEQFLLARPHLLVHYFIVSAALLACAAGLRKRRKGGLFALRFEAPEAPAPEPLVLNRPLHHNP